MKRVQKHHLVGLQDRARCRDDSGRRVFVRARACLTALLGVAIAVIPTALAAQDRSTAGGGLAAPVIRNPGAVTAFPTTAPRPTIAQPGARGSGATTLGQQRSAAQTPGIGRALPSLRGALGEDQAGRLSRAGDTQLLPVARDGEVLSPPQPTFPQDGVIDLREQQALVDGALNDNVDTRLPEDRDAFTTPPETAGFDPQLFLIDDLDPRNDRRVNRLFTQPLPPFDPTGIRYGNFVAFPELELAGSFQSNATLSPEKSPDAALEGRASLRLVSDFSVHAVELRADVNAARFSEFDTEDQQGFFLESRGRLDVRRSTNIQSLVSRTRAQEARSAVDAALVGPRATVVADRSELALNHRFNRLRLQLRGSRLSEEFSDDLDPATGVTILSDRDVTEHAIALRTSWEFKPTLTIFTELEANHRDFDTVAAADGFSRDSTGARYRAGVSFGQAGATLRGEVSLGYGRQDLDEAGLSDVDGMLFDANLAWRATGLTTLLFTASTGFINSSQADAGGVFEQQIGLAARHAFRPYLIGTSGLGLTNRGFAGIGFDEREVAFNLGLEYALRREAVLFSTYERTVFRSDFINSDFENDEFRLGLRLRR
ncbi:MAG: outer membrane beta-barrel protein [Pseudomonadota bacterium]